MTLPPGTYEVDYLMETTQRIGEENLYVEYSGTEGISVTGDLSVSPVLVMRLDNSTLAGTVYDSSGNPIQATVELTNIGGFGQSITFVLDPSGGFNKSINHGDSNADVTLADRSAV